MKLIDTWTRLSSRDRRALLLGAAILVPALLYIGAYRPWRAALDDIAARTAVERSLLEREQRLLADATVLPGAAADAAERAFRARMRLVRAANVPLAEAEVTSHLQTVASLSRVLLQELRSVEEDRRRGAQRSVEPEDLKRIRLALRGESDLEGVLTFLQRIEHSPLLLRVTELSLEPVYEGSARGGDRRSTGVVRFAVVVEAFAPSAIDVAQGEGAP